jgi:hypothetical protein
VLRLQFNRAPAVGAVAVKVNGTAAPEGRLEGHWLEVELRAGRLRTGANVVAVALAPAAPALAWTDLVCVVQPGG